MRLRRLLRLLRLLRLWLRLRPLLRLRRLLLRRLLRLRLLRLRLRLPALLRLLRRPLLRLRLRSLAGLRRLWELYSSGLRLCRDRRWFSVCRRSPRAGAMHQLLWSVPLEAGVALEARWQGPVAAANSGP